MCLKKRFSLKPRSTLSFFEVLNLKKKKNPTMIRNRNSNEFLNIPTEFLPSHQMIIIWISTRSFLAFLYKYRWLLKTSTSRKAFPGISMNWRYPKWIPEHQIIQKKKKWNSKRCLYQFPFPFSRANCWTAVQVPHNSTRSVTSHHRKAAACPSYPLRRSIRSRIVARILNLLGMLGCCSPSSVEG